MMKNILIAVLGIAVVALAVVVVLQWGGEAKTGGDSPPPTQGPVPPTTTQPPTIPPAPASTTDHTFEDGSTENTNNVEEASLPISVTVTNKPPIKVSDLPRLPREEESQDITSLFEASGKGTLATGGGAGDVSFYYLLKTVATSKVEKKDVFDSGRIEVSEIRTFHVATEALKISDVNVRVDLSTLPLDQIENTGYLLAGVVALFDPEIGTEIANAVFEIRDQLDSLDGMEAKPLLDQLERFGIDVRKIVTEPIEEYLNGLLEEVHSHINAVQGKSYRFVYWTDKEGEPLRVQYENVDHSPISQEEQDILNYVNLFIDCQVLPNKNCHPGDTWTISPYSFGSMIGAVPDGTCEGEVRVRRGNDLPNGNWTLSIDPAVISFYRDDQRNIPIGNVNLNGGKAIGDGRKAVLRELQIDGSGKLRKKDSDTYWWFYKFITKTEGDCKFRSTLSPRRED